MSWANLTITRNDIDAYEGVTFNGYEIFSKLGLDKKDDLVLESAKNELEDDIIRTLDNEYDTTDDLLDAVVEADTRDIMKRMLTYKFLANWFFQDSAKEDSLAWSKAREYLGKYYRILNSGLGGIAPNLSKPQNTPRYRLRR